MEFLETTIDKFTFKVAADRLYTENHVWVKPEGDTVRVGLSDYLQQTTGDVAFAEVKPAGVQLAAGDELGTLETIKVNLALPSPVGGVVREVNPRLEEAPEVVNRDPYGEGWLVLIEPSNWPTERAKLLDAPAYYAIMKAEAEAETRER